MSGWELFSSHGLVLIYFSRHPRARLRDAAEAIGLTERAVQNNIRDLAASGHLLIEKVGRRNRYKVVGRKHLTHATTRSVSLRQILQLFKVSDIKTASSVTPAKKPPTTPYPASPEAKAVITAEAPEQGIQRVAEPACNTEVETELRPDPEIKVEPVEEISPEPKPEIKPEPEPEAVQLASLKSAKKNKAAETKDKPDDALPQQDLLF